MGEETSSATKVCGDCEKRKRLSQFYVVTKHGRQRPHTYCKACWKVRNAEAYQKAGAARRQWMRDYRAGLRDQVITAYGGACACCGETERAFLAIDHVNGDGSEHRRILGVAGGPILCRDIIARGFPADFQLLCHNCNVAKYLLGTCPHAA